jgi:hypothetical protein
MSDDESSWRELAERATKEHDSKKLIAIIKELNGVLSQCEKVGRQRRSPALATEE